MSDLSKLLCDHLDFNFIHNIDEEDKILLPLCHTCTFDEILLYLKDHKIEGKMCDVFSEAIVYTFYGRASYISNDTLKAASKGHLASCIVLDPSACKSPHRIYPFDSGTIEGGTKFRKTLLAWNEIKEKLNLGNNFKRINTLVLHYHKNLVNYIKKKKISVKAKHNYEKEFSHISAFSDLFNIYKDPTLGDDRRFSVEVQFSNELELNPSVILLTILPQTIIYDEYLIKTFNLNFEVYPSSAINNNKAGTIIEEIAEKFILEYYKDKL